ncbi:MAG: thioredoxin [Thermoplasmata archaeon]|nr:thioredoxin [Thermoplasmata archaeon]
MFGSFRLRRRKQDSRKPPSVNEWPSHIITLSDKNLSDFIGKYPLSVVDFWAPWCAPCKVILPRLRVLSRKYAGSVAFGRLNIEKNEGIAEQYRIKGIPNLVFFSYGRRVLSVSGVKTIGDIARKIDKMLVKYKG